jgi:acetyl esterase/lipase
VLAILAGRHTRPRWVSTLAVVLGVGSTVVSGTLVAAVVLKVHSLGLPITPQWLSQAAGERERQQSEPEAVTLSLAGGDWHIEADLYRPTAAGGPAKRGAIVVVHGGAWRFGDKGENPWSNQWLVEHGYLVLDVRYTLAPVADWRTPVNDVRCAVAWLRAHAPELNVDPEQIALLGRSAGGHLALLAAYLPDESSACAASVSAVIAFYAPTDLRQSYAETNADADLRAGLRALLGGEPPNAEQTYRAASPLEHANATVPRTLLIHGTWDEPVPVEHSRRLAAALAAHGAQVRLVEVPFARHAFDIVPDGLHTVLAHEAIAAFLEDRLPDRG